MIEQCVIIQRLQLMSDARGIDKTIMGLFGRALASMDDWYIIDRSASSMFYMLACLLTHGWLHIAFLMRCILFERWKMVMARGSAHNQDFVPAYRNFSLAVYAVFRYSLDIWYCHCMYIAVTIGNKLIYSTFLDILGGLSLFYPFVINNLEHNKTTFPHKTFQLATHFPKKKRINT